MIKLMTALSLARRYYTQTFTGKKIGEVNIFCAVLELLLGVP